MIIYMPNTSQQTIGGGWTFMRNLKTGLGGKVQWANRWEDCDLLFINSASVVDLGEVEAAAAAGKAIVFRVDNILKKSRNRRSRINDKMRRFGELADHVIYQSEWAKEYAGFIVGTDHSSVIYNGVNTEIFYPDADADHSKEKRFLFVQFNRDENKRFPEAAYIFHMLWRNDHSRTLTLVGQFSPELVEANFDFFAGEQINFIPPIEDPHVMADIYRDHDCLIFPAFADAAPNTVLEARACGLGVLGVNKIGGTMEMLNPDLDISLDRMCREYYAIFDLILNDHDIAVGA